LDIFSFVGLCSKEQEQREYECGQVFQKTSPFSTRTVSYFSKKEKKMTRNSKRVASREHQKGW
jgi:hypothetical protein